MAPSPIDDLLETSPMTDIRVDLWLDAGRTAAAKPAKGELEEEEKKEERGERWKPVGRYSGAGGQ